VCRIAAARVIELVARPTLTMRKIIDQTKPYRRFASHQPTPA
jgi:hypothetical protein